MNSAVPLLKEFAEKYNIAYDIADENLNSVASLLTSTCFKHSLITVDQMTHLLLTAKRYNLDPFMREIYAYPDKKTQAIIPIVGIDGWSKIINSHPQFDGVEFRYSENILEISGTKRKVHAWCEAVIYRSDRSKPTIVREHFEEVYKDTSAWRSHPNRMMRHKALIQCGRYAFGFSGIFDHDEALGVINNQEILDAEYTDITPRYESDDNQAINQVNDTVVEQVNDAVVEQADSPSLPFMDENRFQHNFNKSKEKISNGLISAETIIATLKMKYTLTNEQVKAFKDLEIK